MKSDNYGPSLHGTLCTKRIYDWTLHRYVTLTVIDLGRAFSIGVKASKYDDPEYRLLNKKPKQTPHEQSMVAAVLAYVQQNADCTTANIVDATGYRFDQVMKCYYDRSDLFVVRNSVITVDGKKRKCRKWEVIE